MELLQNRRCVFIVLVSLVLLGTEAATRYHSSIYMFENQFCMDTQTGRQLYVGEVFTRQGQCVRVQCLGTLQIWEDSCLVPKNLMGDCHPVPPSEENIDYPRCCPLYECKTYKSHASGTGEQTNTYDHYGTLRKSYLTEKIYRRG